MNNTIQKIINDLIRQYSEEIKRFPQNKISKLYFDAHLIIDILIKKYADVYNNFVNGKVISEAHSEISKIIKSSKNVNDTITTGGKSISKNVNGGLSTCHLYYVDIP